MLGDGQCSTHTGLLCLSHETEEMRIRIPKVLQDHLQISLTHPPSHTRLQTDWNLGFPLPSPPYPLPLSHWHPDGTLSVQYYMGPWSYLPSTSQVSPLQPVPPSLPASLQPPLSRNASESSFVSSKLLYWFCRKTRLARAIMGAYDMH